MEIEKLYHYTSVYSANEIMRNRVIWASDARFLNDRKEFVTALNELSDKLNNDDHYKMLIEAISSLSFLNHYCILSLSESYEVLSQWRTYASEGKGCCLAFNKKYITSSPWSGKGEIRNCIYNNHSNFLAELIQRNYELAAQTKDAFNNECEGATNVFWGWVHDNSEKYDNLIADLLSIKNPAFFEEREWRCIYRVSYQDIKTRVRNDLLIPYSEITIRNDKANHLNIMIPELWLGPRADKRNLQGFQTFKLFGFDINFYDCGFI